MKSFKTILITLSILMLPLVASKIGLIGFPLSLFHGREHLSDDLLIKNLESQEIQYQKLITMFREDSPAKVIHPRWISPDNVISKMRWKKYNSLFTELGLDAGMRSWGGDSIWFLSTAQGFVTGGSSKGYMYKPEHPTPIYPNLDQIPKDAKTFGQGYRKINKNWYITFNWDK